MTSPHDYDQNDHDDQNYDDHRHDQGATCVQVQSPPYTSTPTSVDRAPPSTIERKGIG